MANLAGLEKLRPCGRYETYSTAKHHIGFHRNIGVTATYKSSVKPISSLESLVFAVLRDLISAHPNLSAIPVNEDKSYPNVFLIRLPKIDLRTCVEFRERRNPLPKDGEADEELDILLVKEHERNFKDESGTKPMWRLVVVVAADANRSDIFTATWFFHHVIADGRSALLFHEQFVAALNSVSPGVVADPIVESPSTPLPPPFESLHPMNLSWSFFLHAVFKAVLPSIFARPAARLWTGNHLPSDIASIKGPQYRTVVLSTDITKKLTQACRREKTSITATLQCLLAASLFNSLPASQYDKLQINGPISMRRFLREVPDNQMTNATSLYEYMHHRNLAPDSSHRKDETAIQHFSWASSRQLKAAIQVEVAKQGGDNPIALLQYVSDMHKFLLAALSKPRTPSAQVTNLGVYRRNKSEEARPWKIGRMVYSTDAYSTAALAISIITGGDGNATMSFCWMRDAVGEELVGEVIEGVEEGVNKLVV